MKTFNSALQVLRCALHRLRNRRSAMFLSFFRLLCVERRGILLCCIPGAPPVRLPA